MAQCSEGMQKLSSVRGEIVELESVYGLNEMYVTRWQNVSYFSEVVSVFRECEEEILL